MNCQEHYHNRGGGQIDVGGGAPEEPVVRGQKTTGEQKQATKNVQNLDTSKVPQTYAQAHFITKAVC